METGASDIVVTALSAPAEVWLNDSAGNNHWIEFALEGSKSNRDGDRGENQGNSKRSHAIYSGLLRRRIRLCECGPDAPWSGRQQDRGTGRIRWPSGIVQELRDVTADRIVKVHEPSK